MVCEAWVGVIVMVAVLVPLWDDVGVPEPVEDGVGVVEGVREMEGEAGVPASSVKLNVKLSNEPPPNWFMMRM